MTHPLGDLFGRDGHLTMLSLDRYDTGELDDAARRGLELHVEGCAGCRARLAAVTRPAIVPSPPAHPRSDRGRNTGSATIAYLVATSAVALAATALLWTNASGWPSRQTAQHHQVGPSHTAGSYTSVAQEYSDTAGVDLEVEWSDPVVASPSADGWLAIVAVDDALAIVGVPAAPHGVDDEVTLGLGRRWAGHRVIAVLCPAPFSVEIGESFAPEPTCVTRERGTPR